MFTFSGSTSPPRAAFLALATPSTPTMRNATPTKTSPTYSSTPRFFCTHPRCSKSFSRSSHLSRHMRIHLGTKPFFCTIPGCHKKFSRRDCWREHIRGVHGIVSIESSKIPVPAAYPHHHHAHKRIQLPPTPELAPTVPFLVLPRPPITSISRRLGPYVSSCPYLPVSL